MLIKTLLLYMVFCVQLAYGQTYGYSYEGSLDITQKQQFELECAELPHVISCKMRHKDEKGQGEIIIQVEKTERQDQDNPFTPVDVKALLLSYGLKPTNFIEIKTTR
ncbi:MAG: hypothetical protein NXI10_10815 [bacterium]|nr:hypothetical protein [bacterium]